MSDPNYDIKKQIMDKAKHTNKPVSIVIPSMYSHLYTGGQTSYTKWTATPNSQGGIELTYEIQPRLKVNPLVWQDIEFHIEVDVSNQKQCDKCLAERQKEVADLLAPTKTDKETEV